MKKTLPKRRFSKRIIATVLITFSSIIFASAQTIRYVKSGAAGNGTSWQNAGSLQQMIDNSSAGDEVWVAGGTYQPASGQSFSMKEGVKIYGGFSGTETSFSQRQWYANMVTLRGNGARVISNNNNGLTNSAVIDGFTIKEGSTTSGGGIYNNQVSPVIRNCIFVSNQATSGGGVFTSGASSSPMIVNCIFYGNSAVGGGAICAENSSSPRIINCTFSRNYGDTNGRSIYSRTSAVSHIFNCIMFGNNGMGGEITGASNSSGNVLDDPSFINMENYLGNDNIFGTADDGLRVNLNSQAIQAGLNENVPATIATDIVGNPRIQVMRVDAGAYEIAHCITESVVYVDGSKTFSGRGSSWATAFKTLKEAIDMANICTGIQKIYIAKGTYYPTGSQSGTDRNATFLIPQRGLEIYGGYPNGGGTRNITANPTILSGEIGNSSSTADNSYHVMVVTNSLPEAIDVIIDGVTLTGGNANGGQFVYNDYLSNQNEGGGLLLGANYNINNRLTVRNSIITKNNASSTAGGLYIGPSSAVIHNTIISENTCSNLGGGVFIYDSSNTRFVNSVIVKNTAVNGGGIYSVSTNTALKIINCTIADNLASNNGDNLHNNGQTTTTITNSIVWGNNPGKSIYHINSPLTITYSNVASSNGIYTGTGNLNQAPIFKSAATGDFSLMPCSVGINSGNNTALSEVPLGSGILDVSGKPRIYETTVDIGAYELHEATGSSAFVMPAQTSETICLGSSFPEKKMTANGGQQCFIINENASQTITAPQGLPFTEVIFASYGNASGTCPTGFTMGSCNAVNSKSIIEALAIGNNSFTITANNAIFGDPCSGTAKKLCLILRYGDPEYEYTWTNDNPSIGIPASGTGNIPAFTALVPGTANFTVIARENACRTSQPVTFSYTVEDNLILYVDGSITASGTGRTWSSAFKTLGEALNVANQCAAVKTINVAAGTYYPTGVQAGTDRHATFLIPQRGGIGIFGGFPVGGGARNIAANPTVLSGNIGNINSFADNSYHVLTVVNTLPAGEEVTIDGLTITGSYGYNFSNANLTFTYNGEIVPVRKGGGIYIRQSDINIQGARILNNNSDEGAGIFIDASSSVRITNTEISQNSASAGSGIYNESSLTVINSTLAYNTGLPVNGMNLYNSATGVTSISNSILWNNSAEYNINNLGDLTATYSDIQQSTGIFSGEGNLNEDPIFKDLANKNYSLSSCSPLVNRGNNGSLSGLTGNSAIFDVLGNSRIFNTTVDIGAYEIQSFPDTVTMDAPPSQLICEGSMSPVITFSGQYNGVNLNYSWSNNNTAIGLAASGTGNLPSFMVLQAGTATITVMASLNECTASAPVTFTLTSETEVNLYVDANVTASGNGRSWLNAYKTLTEALNYAAQCKSVKTINVAKGTYMPASGDAFTMIEGVQILGGYPNGGGTRDIVANLTVLRGNNDRVIYNEGNNLTPEAILDGFSITNGSTSHGGGGAGIYNYLASPTLSNLVVYGNTTTTTGGGIRNSSSSPVITNVVIRDNYGASGGGITNTSSSPKMTNVIIKNNTASYNGQGAGILDSSSSSVLTNVLIVDNEIPNGGSGTTVRFSNSNSILTNVTISGNRSFGGIQLGGSSNDNLKIRNSVISGNIPALYSQINSAIEFKNSLMEAFGYANDGTLPINTNPLFVNPAAGDYRLQDNSPLIDKGSTTYYASGQTPDISSAVNDLDNVRRHIGLGIDIGAFESLAPLEGCPDGTVWDGTSWNNGLPDTNKKVFVTGDFILSTDMNACKLEVTTEGSVTIPSGLHFAVSDKITNKATAEDFVVESGGSLLQVNDVQNTGTITVKRNSFPLYRQDYTLWGSPVVQYNLRNFSPQTLFNRFYSYDTDLGSQGEYVQEIFTNADVQNKLFEPAKGYMIRMPNDWPVYVNSSIAGTPYLGKFVGVPNNGTISIPLSTENTAMNLVANPYPSPLSISDLFTSNPGIEQTIYFWRKRNGVAGSGYASYNTFGLTSPQPEIDGLNLQDAIAVGQGFFVQSKGATALQFNNTIRRATSGNIMLRSGAERHRIWLNLSHGTDVIGQTLLGYATGATLGADNGLDGVYFNDSSTALTSLIGNEEYAIQARPVPFDTTDEVPLGFKTNVAGLYSISLSNRDGLFSNSQDIFLKDSWNNQLHDLKLSAYGFTTNEGTFNDRFSVVYQSALNVENPLFNPDRIVVYRQEEGFFINSGTIIMQKIELFDIRGRLIYILDSISNTTAKIEGLNIAHQVLIMKITSRENQTAIKKVIY